MKMRMEMKMTRRERWRRWKKRRKVMAHLPQSMRRRGRRAGAATLRCPVSGACRPATLRRQQRCQERTPCRT
jgi:hypothetical protein